MHAEFARPAPCWRQRARPASAAGRRARRCGSAAACSWPQGRLRPAAARRCTGAPRWHSPPPRSTRCPCARTCLRPRRGSLRPDGRLCAQRSPRAAACSPGKHVAARGLAAGTSGRGRLSVVVPDWDVFKLAHVSARPASVMRGRGRTQARPFIVHRDTRSGVGGCALMARWAVLQCAGSKRP